jgi:DNA-binding MarR family transcriptional regulator
MKFPNGETMPGLHDDAIEFTEMLRVLAEGFGEIPEMIDRMQELGINRNHGRILRAVAAEGGQTMSDLARAIRLSDSSATILVDLLVKKKLAVRKRTEDDRRVVLVAITASGRKVLEAHTRAFVSFAHRVLASLGEEERVVYLALHRKIVDTIKKSNQRPTDQ